MSTVGDHTLLGHLEALRSALLRCLAVTALLFPVGYAATPLVIAGLVRWCLPPELGGLHFFSPLEVFLVRLKLALLLALAAAYPWNLMQLWRFLVPALHEHERGLLRRWVVAASLLFFAGVIFSVLLVLPLLMRFASQFADDQLRPMLGLAQFLGVSGWLSLAFGLMFQTPVLVLPAVRLGLVSCADLRRRRPVVMTVILIVAAILTPPDVVSQLLLAVPTWLLFELGLYWAGRREGRLASATAGEAADGCR
ncbi:MAG: twin-arginine translocase subunit TatC [Lentisphaeria bacterium]|nr:twin-arginine translocase subunit TatC [Lentisphaeria bacterium]